MVFLTYLSREMKIMGEVDFNRLCFKVMVSYGALRDQFFRFRRDIFYFTGGSK
jgi:hypothetical protein